MGGNLEVKGGGALTDTTGGIIVRAMARAVVASKVTRVSDGHATEMSAHSDHHQPLRVLYALVIVLRIAESFHCHRFLG